MKKNKEKTLAESIKEIQDWVKEKDFQFPTHEELMKMREDEPKN